MKTVLTISYVASLYFAGGLMATLLDVWMWKRGWSLREDKLTDTLFAMLWPLYLPILILALLYRGTSFLVSRIQEAAGQEAHGTIAVEAKDIEGTGRTLERIIRERQSRITRIFVSESIWSVIKKDPEFKSYTANFYGTGWHTDYEFRSISIQLDPELEGYCFYWKEKF